jgi:hypothetical protein
MIPETPLPGIDYYSAAIGGIDPAFGPDQTVIMFPDLDHAVKHIGKKVLGADVIIQAPEPPPTNPPKPIPANLPPIPAGWLYVGEDNGAIETGAVSTEDQTQELRWFNRAYNHDQWKSLAPSGYISDLSHGWHAIAQVGSELARLNAGKYEQAVPTPGPVPICVGPPIISILAKEGQWTSAEGHGTLIAADGLFGKDPYTELGYYHQFTADVAKGLGWSTLEINLPEVVTEIQHLRRWKNEQMIVSSRWNRVYDFVQGNPEAPLGCNVSEIVLSWLKQRDALKAELDTEREIRKAHEANMRNLLHYAEGREGHVPVCGHALDIRDALVTSAKALRQAKEELRSAGVSNVQLVQMRDCAINECDALKEKLSVLDEVMRDNIDLKAECERLVDLWRKAKVRAETLKDEVICTQEAWQKDHMEMKRQLDAKAQAPCHPVPIYRMLVTGEVIEEGDEFNITGEWRPSNGVGNKVTPPYVGRYRRKV